jgi:AAA domain-containing protein
MATATAPPGRPQPPQWLSYCFQLDLWADQVGVPRDKLFMVHLRDRRNPLEHPEDREKLAKLLREHEVETLIVDPFAQAYPGTDQDGAGPVGAWLNDLNMFARCEVGATDLALTTHTGWNTERTRGSSAQEDWADSILTMTKGDGEERYLRAFGRDVFVEEDRLQYDPTTRHLSLTGEGSRKEVRHTEKAEYLVPAVAVSVKEHPGQSSNSIKTAMADLYKNGGITFSPQPQDVGRPSFVPRSAI